MLAQARRASGAWLALGVIVISGPVLAGCFASHTRGSEPEPEPEVRPDAGPIVVDAASGGSCSLASETISVRTEAITRIRPERCDDLSSFSGAVIYEVETVPAERGIRLALDLCPDADDDCRCSVFVSGVGSDLAGRIRTGGGRVLGQIAPHFIILEDADVVCATCEGCVCPAAGLVLYAADAHPNVPPATPSTVSFSIGTESCHTDPEPDWCWSERHRVRMTENVGFLAVVPEVIEVDENLEGRMMRNGVWLRVRRSSRLICRDRPPGPRDPGPPAAWVAWME
jgi:hypothetical protein